MSRVFFTLTLWIGSIFYLHAQDIKIELGPDEIAKNQYFTIAVEVSNERIKEYSTFPNIPGFEKSGISNSSSMNVINGQVSSTHSIIQNYEPTRQGTFDIPAFTLTINGKEVSSSGKTVKVGPPKKRQGQYGPRGRDPFDDFFGAEKEREFVEVKDDAFLALSIDKDEVFVGEGVNVSLGFYISEANRAVLKFHETGKQVSEIAKKIRPKNCWEENFNIESSDPERVTINGKRHVRYKIYQATYYPFNTEAITFPQVDLEMIKFKQAKKRTFFGRNAKADYKTYHSKPKRVEVKPLPPHPLKEQVSVGKFILEEEISSKSVETGESFNYDFSIYGEGNVASINEPTVSGKEIFDFYAPNIEQRVNRSNNSVRGSKTFKYYAIPKEPGDYPLADYLHWVYFDPELKQYDTLKSEITIHVTGESKRNEYISSSDLGSFYDIIDIEKNKLRNIDEPDLMKWILNILTVVLLMISLIFIFKK